MYDLKHNEVREVEERTRGFDKYSRILNEEGRTRSIYKHNKRLYNGRYKRRRQHMGKMSDLAIELLDTWGEEVDKYYTQFVEVAYFLNVPADYTQAVEFIKRKIPVLTDSEIGFLIDEITGMHNSPV